MLVHGGLQLEHLKGHRPLLAGPDHAAQDLAGVSKLSRLPSFLTTMMGRLSTVS